VTETVMNAPAAHASRGYRYLPANQRENLEAPFDDDAAALCEAREDVIFLTADLSTYTDLYRVPKERPRQFLDVGMAEQNLMCIAGGLAKTGFTPIATTFACYATRRAFDQMVMSMGTGPSHGVVIGFAAGIASSARIHHQATDDIAMMRAVPGACVLDPADPTEMRQALNAAIDYPGLAYIRGMRGTVQRLFDPQSVEFRVGQGVLLQEGSDSVGVIATGYGTQWAIEAVDELQANGGDPGLLHLPCLKPAPTEDIQEFCSRFSTVYTIENHNVIGGLGSLVAETVSGAGLPTRVRRNGIRDQWADNGGMAYLRERLGLTGAQLASWIAGDTP
jgi:transketolase